MCQCVSENSRVILQELLHALTELNKPERISAPEWLRVEGNQQTIMRSPVYSFR